MIITASNNLPAGTAGSPYEVDLSATGGVSPYQWTLAADSSLPEGLTLVADKGVISGRPAHPGTTRFTVTAEDHGGHQQTADFLMTITAKRKKGPFARLAHVTTWLSFFALVAPGFGYASIVVYEFANPGSHWAHLAVGTLTSMTAFLAGALTGFILATPRVVSSGQLKPDGVSLGSNLAEISDWLTKLLLGAGLVELTHLGRPIGSLIDRTAAGLLNPGPGGGATENAKLVAGLIIFGYVVLGLLEGYVVTSVWYPEKLGALNDAVKKLPKGANHH